MPAIDQSALGLIETQGLVAAIEAADAMVKTADVRVLRQERTSPALVTILIRGEVAAVQAAVDAGRAAAEGVGVVLTAHVIARPDPELAPILQPEAEATTSRLNVQDDLEDLTVRELRALARNVEGLPIQGREIARARKDELIRLLSSH